MPTPAQGVTTVIKPQHEHVKALLDRVSQHTGPVEEVPRLADASGAPGPGSSFGQMRHWAPWMRLSPGRGPRSR